MQPEYFETRFKLGLPAEGLPDTFAIITAFQTTGQTWSDKRNQEATDQLQAALVKAGALLGSATGYSPRTGHAEPGFAASISFEQACDLGQHYQQDAIYFVTSGTLFVSHCDHRRALSRVTRFLERVDAPD